MNKETKKVIREYLKKGWTLKPGRKHLKMLSPTGRVVAISSSPSDSHAYKNVRRDLELIEQNADSSL